MPNPVTADGALQVVLEQMKAGFMPPSTLRLFGNNFTPTPDSHLFDFIESTYNGYGRQSLQFDLNPIQRVANGVYEFSVDQKTFTSLAVQPQNVFGWYIASDDGWVYAGRFLNPIGISVGTPVHVNIVVQSISLSTFF